MSLVTYTFLMGLGGSRTYKSVVVNLVRPKDWVDATRLQRKETDLAALRAPLVLEARVNGYRIVEIYYPVCECSVNQIPRDERDQTYLGASDTCTRCGGPQPA